MYAVTVAAREAGGTVADAAEHAWGLFTDATRTAPEAATAVLTHPSAGPALFGLLAQLRHPDGQLPPPVQWFTALAVSAADRAGLPTRAGLPLAGSWAALPSLGRARFPGARPGDRAEVHIDGSGHCHVTAAGETVPVPGLPYTDGPLEQPGTPHRSHHPPRRLPRHRRPLVRRASARHPRRGRPAAAGHPRPAMFSPLGTPSGRHLRRRGTPLGRPGAGRLPAPACRPSRGVRRTGRRTTSVGAADPSRSRQQERQQRGDVRLHGAVPADLGDGPRGDAHARDAAQQACGAAPPLRPVRTGRPPRDASTPPGAPTPAPFPGLFHGAYAHLGVARFWERRRETEPDPALRATAHAQFARWRLAAHEATTVTLSSGRLTPLGHRFAQRMLTTLDTLCRLPVPAPALHHAESAARAHRTDWQHRNGDLARRLVGVRPSTACSCGARGVAGPPRHRASLAVHRASARW